MRFSKQLIAVAVVASTLAFVLPAAADDLTVDSWELTTAARTSRFGGTTQEQNFTVVNQFNETQLAIRGDSTSSTEYDIAWDAFGGSFNCNFDHSRTGGLSALGKSNGRLAFTVANVDMDYDISGMYSQNGGTVIQGKVQLLKDGAPVFFWEQRSECISNEVFVVGQRGGDATDILIGSPSGTLAAGHSYQLIYNFFITNLTTDSGATGAGDFHFTITGPDACERTETLIGDVVLLNLQNGIANNLDAKLDAVVRVLDDLNQNNDVAACNALEGFINAVEAQSGNHIPVDDAIALIDATQQIIALLGCSP